MRDEEVIANYYALRSCRAVAECYSVSAESVRRLLRRNGIALTGWKTPKRESRYHCPSHIAYSDEEVIDAYTRLGTQTAVRDALGISHTTVHRILKRHGIPATGRTNNAKITDDEILEDIGLGLTRHEIAEKRGVHVENLQRRMRKLGVHAKYAGTHPHVYADKWHYVAGHDRLVRDTQPGFQYQCSIRESANLRQIKLICRSCGTELIRDRSGIKRYKIECECCKQNKKEQQELMDSRIKMVRFLYTLQIKNTPKRCAHCGGEFYSQYPLAAYCSERCKEKAKKQRRKTRDPEGYRASRRRRSRGKYASRTRRYGGVYEHGITLSRVRQRDKDICQICGKPCDITDKSWGSVGPLYPSVDHIQPLSKGGSHTWDNVQLAHMICNSMKGDRDAEQSAG